MGEDHCCIVHSKEEYLLSVRCGLWTVEGHYNGFFRPFENGVTSMRFE